MSRPDGGSVRKVRLLPTGWLESLRQAGLGAPLIVLLVPVLVTVWIYVGRDAGSLPLLTPLARHWSGDVLDAVYEYLTALLLLFAVPVLVGRILLERRPEELGLTPGDVGLGLRLVAILLPLALLTAYLGSLNPQMRSEYPLAKSVMFHPWFFLGIEVVYLVYYFAWEFCFRGFMLFGLEREWGVVAAVLVQTLTSTMAHIGKPFIEIMAALGAGLVLGYIAVRTRSIYYGLFMHAIVGVATDIFITMHLR